MAIWLLRPRPTLPPHDDPWDPGYGKCFGFVVRAASEAAARRHADKHAGGENRGGDWHPWLDASYSTCTEVRAGGRAGVVLRDYLPD